MVLAAYKHIFIRKHVFYEAFCVLSLSYPYYLIETIQVSYNRNIIMNKKSIAIVAGLLMASSL